MKVAKLSSNRGFTIVELMIAMSIMATLLVISTILLIQIGSIYTKGVNQANLQNATRNMLADIGSSLQFGGNGFSVGSASYGGIPVRAYCIGSVRYSYILDRELGDDPGNPPAIPAATTPHVLWRDVRVTNAACAPLDITANLVKSGGGDTSDPDPVKNGYEMVGEHMRIHQFDINETPPGQGLYQIEVHNLFGDSDLIDTTNWSCRGDSGGSQFCAVASLSDTVITRVK